MINEVEKKRRTNNLAKREEREKKTWKVSHKFWHVSRKTLILKITHWEPIPLNRLLKQVWAHSLDFMSVFLMCYPVVLCLSCQIDCLNWNEMNHRKFIETMTRIFSTNSSLLSLISRFYEWSLVETCFKHDISCKTATYHQIKNSPSSLTNGRSVCVSNLKRLIAFSEKTTYKMWS